VAVTGLGDRAGHGQRAAAATGIYAVTSLTVAQRTGEIGILTALRAEPRSAWRVWGAMGMASSLYGNEMLSSQEDDDTREKRCPHCPCIGSR
jgi:hypothetical protein